MKHVTTAIATAVILGGCIAPPPTRDEPDQRRITGVVVRQNGEAFLDDPAAGFIGLNASLQGGAGGVNPNSLENSNVDIGAEFTKMIVAQRSYSANARMITTADEMLQEVVNLKR